MAYKCVSSTRINDTLYSIWKRLANKYGTDEADAFSFPLEWYVRTGRINTDDLHTLCFSNARQTSIIADKLAKGGSVEEAVECILDYLHKIEGGKIDE